MSPTDPNTLDLVKRLCARTGVSVQAAARALAAANGDFDVAVRALGEGQRVVSDRVQFDDALALYHGGVLRSPSSATGDEARLELEAAVARGLAALDAGSAAHSADIEREPSASVEVHQAHDVETGDLILLWRVACRQRGQRIQ